MTRGGRNLDLGERATEFVRKMEELFGVDKVELTVDRRRVGQPPREWLDLVNVSWPDGLAILCGLVDWDDQVLIMDPDGEHFSFEAAARYISLRREGYPAERARKLA
ncbi:hypothetical protein IDVR_27010 [Intrasporangium sp. DVR]